MWWYNILGDNKGIVSHILLLDPITEEFIIITDNLFAMKRGSSEPISTVKIT